MQYGFGGVNKESAHSQPLCARIVWTAQAAWSLKAVAGPAVDQ
jgi:hypothetical protein